MREVTVGAAIGILVALAGAWIVGYLAAISTQQLPALIDLVGLIGWELLIVQLPGFGVLAFFLCFLCIMLMKLEWRITVATGFVVSQVVLSLLSWPHLNLYFLHLIPLGACMVIAGYAASLISGRNKKLQPMR